MALNELISKYNAETQTEQKGRWLAAIAECLPAPEFLWYPLAIEALQHPDLSLRQVALGMMAHAPQSWDMVLVAALTSGDRDFQQGALRTLAAHAGLVPHLKEAFVTLGSLPGWHAEARDLWQVQQAALSVPREVPAVELVVPADALFQVNAELRELTLERDLLARARAELEAQLARERDASSAIAEQLENARLQLDSARQSHIGEAAVWVSERETSRQIFDERLAVAQGSLAALQKRHQNTVRATGAAAALLLVLGVPAAVAWTHTPVFQTGKSPAPAAAQLAHQATRPPAPHHLAPPAPAPRHVGEPAQPTGGSYREALAALAARADALARRGYLYPALATWRSYGSIAHDASDARRARVQADQLVAEIRQQAAKPSHLAIARQTLAKLTRRRLPPVPAPVEPAVALEAPGDLGGPVDANAAIPDQIRAKF